MNLSYKIFQYAEEISNELVLANQYRNDFKDILIVTHDNLDFLKKCVQSIRECTEDYQIYIWDNASPPEVDDWLADQSDLKVFKSQDNLGFIYPNNRLAEKSTSPYIICLNDDTIVKKGWDQAMIGYLQVNNIAQVGYCGGWCNQEGKGVSFGWGGDVDYICGYCFCIPRKVYETHGLFDEANLFFAYCEDADLSFRLRESGLKIHALHLDYVDHHENVTIKKVVHDTKLKNSILANYEYMRKRWRSYLSLSSNTAET